MPGIVDLVAAISDDVITSLAAANYPELVDGRILLGKQYQFEQSAPPRIIFTPTSSSFGMKDISSASNVQNGGGYTAEQLLTIRNRAIVSDDITFEVRCWGRSPDNDPDDDFDFTQALYQQVIRSVHLLAVGAYSLGGGKWTDATYSSAQNIRDGREFVFQLTLFTPITAQLEPLPLAPSNVAPGEAVYIQLPDGQVELGWTNEDE